MVDIDDVAAVLGRDLTDPEMTRAGRLLEMAEGLVESTLPGFSYATGTETVTVTPGDPDVLWTPRYPVTTVTSVTAGSVLDPDSYEWNEFGRITASTSLLNDFEINLGGARSPVTVAYGFGLDPCPDDAALVVAAMVAAAIRRQTNSSGAQSETIDGYQVSYGDWAVREAAVGMTVPPGALARWKRNKTVSVPLYR